ncbi:MAG: nucleotide exchange factor GrpE [Thiohalocapsa sp.]
MKEQDEQAQYEQERAEADLPGAKSAFGQAGDTSASAAPEGTGDGAAGDQGAAADPAELHMLLEDARARADQDRDQLLRVRAEMENMKRRQSKELENAHKFALEGFVKELLQVRDSLELGYAAATEADADVGKLREGTELTLKQLGDAMSKFGVERVHPEGEAFNPEFHQAMSVQPRADLPPNTVTAVIQSGYLLNGRLMRPALVMVSKQA